jgi:hypothetical protein
MQFHTDPSERLVMVPFDERESISIAMAAKLSGKAPNTIRSWAEQYGIGRKIGGAWHISRVALQIFLDGDKPALAAYHAGDRTDSAVRSYFERAGCGVLQKSQKQASDHHKRNPEPSELELGHLSQRSSGPVAADYTMD